MKLKPNEHGDIYTVKITYKCGGIPQAILLSPEIQCYDGKLSHHTYGLSPKEEKPILCVCAPGFQEWNPNLWIAESFVPWVCTWLNTYEFWLITGNWYYDEYGKQRIDLQA